MVIMKKTTVAALGMLIAGGAGVLASRAIRSASART